MRGAGPVVVRAHGEHQHHPPVVALRSVDEAVDVLDSLLVVALSREHLLELVHGQHHPLIRAEPVERTLQVRDRVSTGPDDDLPPALAAGKHAVAESGEQSGPQGRRLAAAGRAD